MNNPAAGQPPRLWLGYLSALGVVAIWSSFIVISRLGLTSGLTAYDVTALRFIVGAVITLPFVILHWPRHVAWKNVVFLIIFGPGALYSVIMYLGLARSPAAYAGVFANGTIPIFTALLAFTLLGERLNKIAFAAIAVIFAGGWMVGAEGMSADSVKSIDGVIFFLGGSLMVSIFVLGVRHWKLTPKNTLAIINLPNAFVFLPIWYFWLPSTLETADIKDIVIQALFQGLGPGFLAIIMMTHAVHTLGPTLTTGFAAWVPTVAAIMAIPVLGELLSPLEWVGILTVTAGLSLLIWRR